MNGTVFQWVGRERGQNTRTYQFNITYKGADGNMVSEVASVNFERDTAKNAFLWRPRMTADGKLMDEREIALVEQIKERLVPPEDEAEMHSAYVQVLQYSDIADRTVGYGKSLSDMSPEDFKYWLNTNSIDAKALNNALRALKECNGNPSRQNEIRVALKGLETSARGEEKSSPKKDEKPADKPAAEKARPPSGAPAAKAG